MKSIKQSLCLLLAAVLLTFALCSCSSPSNTGASAGTAEAAIEQTTVPETTAPDKAEELIEKMSLEEKVGQMFLARCPDINAAEDAAKYHLGGYILFGRDFEDKTEEQVKADIQSYQGSADLPLLIAVDEEGGTVVRVSDCPLLCKKAFLSPKENYELGGWEEVERTETEKAELLTSLGINVNMAPVCDLTANTESFMFDRSFSGDRELTSRFVSKTVKIYSDKKLGSVLKHFPGYGDNTDTHEDMSYDSKPYEEFAENDFIPFKKGIESGADCVMTAHNIMACVDENYPASLSEKVHKLLREELNFDGVIMTDDLVMQAITKYTGAEAAAVTAAKCGNDMLCCSDYETQYPAVVEAVQRGEIPMKQIDGSVKRILKWKEKLGLIER